MRLRTLLQCSGRLQRKRTYSLIACSTAGDEKGGESSRAPRPKGNGSLVPEQTQEGTVECSQVLRVLERLPDVIEKSDKKSETERSESEAAPRSSAGQGDDCHSRMGD